MKIKYIGTQLQTVVEYAEKRYGFNPECEVKNEEVIKFLLGTGLFINLDGEVKKAVENTPTTEIISENAAPNSPIVEAKIETVEKNIVVDETNAPTIPTGQEEKKAKRGRPKKRGK